MIVAVYGASGHTGRFVLAELLQRSHTPIAVGRDAIALTAAAQAYAAPIETRVARLTTSPDDADALDRALAGAQAVINCAGPFLDTAQPLIEAALRAGIDYFDLTAEQESARATFADCDTLARKRGICIVPAAGFYGGLGDLLATCAMRDWDHADSIDLAIALDSWLPTLGTRRTGERNTIARVTITDGELRPIAAEPPTTHTFAAPFGRQTMIAVPLSEMVLIARHLRVREVRNYLNDGPLNDLADPSTATPIATDARGRSNQQFAFEVTARRGSDVRRVAIRGRDIYAVSAPIAVAALEYVHAETPRQTGVRAVGELGDAREFLDALLARGELHEEALSPARS